MDAGRIDHQIDFGVQRVDKNEKQQGVGFADAIKNAIYRVSDMQAQANQSAQELMQGKTGIHETMLELQKAGISLRVLLQIRNKVIEAYKEVMHMPI
ncbi:MAG: flagellar hook-basal body complex protein FliE [Pseudomonadota bacterium]